MGYLADWNRIGMILSRYKSGPLPKPFKVLPTIPHWEEILQITRPEQWYVKKLLQSDWDRVLTLGTGVQMHG